MSTLLWAAWGLLGAIVYAGPRLLVRWGESRVGGTPIWMGIAEFIFALIVGPIFAVGFGPFCAGIAKSDLSSEQRALGLVIGMVANPIAPSVVKAATGAFLKRLGGDRNP